MNSAYKYQDNLTWRKDPVGRELTYTYASNGIHVVEVRNTTAGRSDALRRLLQHGSDLLD